MYPDAADVTYHDTVYDSRPHSMTRKKNPKLERAHRKLLYNSNFNKTYPRIDDTYAIGSFTCESLVFTKALAQTDRKVRLR